MADFEKKSEELDKGQKFPIGEAHKVVVPKSRPRVRLIGLFFDLDKAFLLPGAMAGIKGVRKVYRKHPDANILVVGHTDTSGPDDANLKLSLERAEATVAYLTDDVPAWDKFFAKSLEEKKRWGAKEIQLMLSVLPDRTPKDKKFFRSPFSGKFDEETKKAISTFQVRESLPVTGDADEPTRKLIITRYMAIDDPALPKDKPKSAQFRAHGCGENFPDVPTADGVRKDENRRVEVYFFDGDVIPAPAADRLSRKGATDYPKWKEQATETIDFRSDGAGPQRKLKLRILKDAVAPLADKPFRLEVGGVVIEGSTDSDGNIAEDVPAGAAGGALVFLGKTPDGGETELWRLDLEFEDLPAPASVQGAQHRLNNLGLMPGRTDGKIDSRTRRAIRRFQALAEIKETGNVDGDTASKLEQAHGI